MDSNGFDTDHLDPDVRLPPRKRLLAGLKKQSCSESTSQCSQENSPSLNVSQSIDESPLSEFDVRLNNLLKLYKNGTIMSPEEIAMAAEAAACSAAKAAEAAKAVAEEKAAVAAKAVAAAKRALDLVASVSEETGSKDKHQKRNKLKKHVPVQVLYDKYQPTENCGEDEEIARKLHRTMNSSPRITKHSPCSDSKNHKHKKLKMTLPNGQSGISDWTNEVDGNVKSPPQCNGLVEGGMDCEGSNEEPHIVKVDEKMSKFSKDYEVEVDSGEAESSHPKEKKFKVSDDLCTNGRKRGRIKQKKLPLSILSSKDQAHSKEESSLTNSLITRDRTDKSAARQLVLLSMDHSGDNVSTMEIAPTWKCQDFNVSQCIKQDKLVQS
ncbi:hypothetical protein vseg_005151 [Gypsophila vaccaria]